MKVGVAREVKNREYRVAITPCRGDTSWSRAGHDVLVEHDAGAGSSHPGRRLRRRRREDPRLDPDDVWGEADLLLKVKEPIAEEYGRMRAGQTLFTYLHLAASRDCTDALLDAGIDRGRVRDGADRRRRAAAARPDVRGRRADGPAGRRAHPGARRRRPRRAAWAACPACTRPRSSCIGAGVSGMNAATIALGMQAEVLCSTATSTSCAPPTGSTRATCRPIASNAYEIERAVLDADLVIGAVLVPGAKAPTLVPQRAGVAG